MSRSNPKLRVECCVDRPNAKGAAILEFARSFCDRYEGLMAGKLIPEDRVYRLMRSRGCLPAGTVWKELERLNLQDPEYLKMCEKAKVTVMPVNLIKEEIQAIEQGVPFADCYRKSGNLRNDGVQPEDQQPAAQCQEVHQQEVRQQEVHQQEVHQQEVQRQEEPLNQSVPGSKEESEATGYQPFAPEYMSESDIETMRLVEKRGQCREIILPEDSMFVCKNINETMIEASKKPKPAKLWKTLWVEGEICCLYASTNIGKSIYALQIANEIAATRNVLYIDFEMNDKQLQERYTDEEGNLFTFQDNLCRAYIDPKKLSLNGNFEDKAIADIENLATMNDCEVIIVDNITFLCNDNISSEAAGKLMMSLIDLKQRRGFSILILAHTPKRDESRPLTVNDLAGSKKISNFLDSAFCMGVSVKDSSMRYIKEIKNRQYDKVYDEDNVILCEIRKDGNWLHFEERGFAKERTLLKEPNEKEDNGMTDQVLTLRKQGMSFKDIAARTGLSLSKVFRICKSHQDRTSEDSDSSEQ